MAQQNQCGVPLIAALPVVAVTIGFFYKSEEYRMTKDLTEAQLCAFNIVQKFYSDDDVLDVVVKLPESHLIAFNNLVAQQESCDGYCMTMLAYNVAAHEWTYEQSLAVSKLSIEESISQNFSEHDLVALYFGTSLEQINDNLWNASTSFLLNLGMSVEDVLIRGAENTKKIYDCAFRALEETNSSRAVNKQCEIDDASPISEDAASLLENSIVLEGMSGCSAKTIFDL